MKKNRSILEPYREELIALQKAGRSYRSLAEWVFQEKGVRVSHNAVFHFLTRNASKSCGLFFEGFPSDIQDGLIRQLTALWTHDSTAIEGNTLTLGETIKVLELGLTISGKSLKDHEEVYGHAKAIELIYELIKRKRIEPEDLFNLHRCVMQKSAIDSLRPVGDWKRDYNGTTGVHDGMPVYVEYASPSDTPHLMTRWLKEFNRKLEHAGSPTKAINVYAWAHFSFVRIHPFFDGNGRVARLIANLPLLRSGQPPILIPEERRAEYIDLLWSYQNEVGVIRSKDRLLPPGEQINAFKKMIKDEWQTVQKLVNDARIQAQQREGKDGQ